MWDNFITRQIRRTNRNLLITGVIFLAGVAALGGAYRRYLYNFAFGPFSIPSSELTSISNPDDPRKYFLRVQGDKVLDTGMYLEVQDSSKKVTAKFYALAIGDRLLVVKAPPDNKQVSYMGALVAVPYELRTGFIPRMEAKYPNLLGAFLPFMLDATGFRDSKWNPRRARRGGDAPAGALSGVAIPAANGKPGKASADGRRLGNTASRAMWPCKLI